MQYLLTDTEYNELVERGRYRKASLDANLQAFCTRIANELPISGWHANYGGKDGKKPWGCIITEAKTNNQDWYCDDCPSKEICPYEGKEWSK